MKAKVIIENSQTTIELTPENAFEKDVIEKINLDSFKKKPEYSTTVHFDNAPTPFFPLISHKITITIKEEPKP